MAEATGGGSARLKPPAVDGVNGKVDLLGGTLGDRSLYGARGSFSFPLPAQLGVQLDGVYGQLGNSEIYGIGGHGFWRDPSVGLLGLFASHVKWQRLGGIELNHVAAEGELYRGPITFRVLAGRESGNSGSQTSGGFTESFSIKSRFFANASAAYYVRENLVFSGGILHLAGKVGASFAGEWAFASSERAMWSLFVEGFAGDGKFHGVWTGVKVYFGQSAKSLMRRQREDDPINNMPNVAFGGTNAATRTATAAAASQCPPGQIFFGGACVVP